MQSYITELRGARQNSPPDFYHYSSFIPALKQKSLPLYQILKKGEFIWDKTAMRAWNDLLYLISLRIINYIYIPTSQPSDLSHRCKRGRAECYNNAVVQGQIKFEDYSCEKHTFHNRPAAPMSPLRFDRYRVIIPIPGTDISLSVWVSISVSVWTCERISVSVQNDQDIGIG